MKIFKEKEKLLVENAIQFLLNDYCQDSLFVNTIYIYKYIYTHIYIYIYTHTHIYIYINQLTLQETIAAFLLRFYYLIFFVFFKYQSIR
jgi:hypothetical protein